MEILSPVWPSSSAPRPTKSRPRALEGAVIALVDDNLDAPFTMHLETLLGSHYGAKVKRLVKPSGTAPAPRELIDEAATDTAAAVVGIGL
jgi:hypothetical protein